MIAAFVLLTLVLLLSDRTAPITPQMPAGSNSISQAHQSPKEMNLAIESVPIESP